MRACVYCGGPTGKYALCLKCNTLKEQGKIAKCEICGKWYDTSKPCVCQESLPAKTNKIEEKKVSSEGVCIVCGKPAPKGDLCYSCYKKKQAESEKEEEKKVSDEGICIVCGKPAPNGELCYSCYKNKQSESEKAEESKVLGDGICVVCGKDAPKGYLCYDCYKKKEAEKAEFNLKRPKQEAVDHYYKQRASIFRIKNPEYMENGAIRMFAIAEEVASYKDNYLKDRVVEDVRALMKNKKDKKDKKTKESVESSTVTTVEEKKSRSFDDVDYRKQWVAEHQCDDGHYVRSYSEVLIDNWLFNNKYSHAYEKSVFMNTDPDAVVLSDFYLPEGDVYIEFWGLKDDKQYLKRKEQKLKMYKENNKKLINLEEPDIKRLNDVLPRKLHEYIPKND